MAPIRSGPKPSKSTPRCTTMRSICRRPSKLMPAVAVFSTPRGFSTTADALAITGRTEDATERCERLLALTNDVGLLSRSTPRWLTS